MGSSYEDYEGGDEKHGVGVETGEETPLKGIRLLFAPEVDDGSHYKRNKGEKDN